jgi:DNA repair protein RecO (recombination protein O)
MLRRIDHGDYDLIITFFTLNRGKIPIIAKSARKSIKRFSGILELFSILHMVCTTGRGNGLPMLQEATLKKPFSRIRGDVKKTAYASYWAELIDGWMEKGQKQAELYHLFRYVLEELDLDHTSEEALSMLFQMRFMKISGLCPNLTHCSVCRSEIEDRGKEKVIFDLGRGGVVCDACVSSLPRRIYLSKGTLKQLLWIRDGDLKKAGRMRFTPRAAKEGLDFLEAFVPYHLEKEPRSLKFLREIRR